MKKQNKVLALFVIIIVATTSCTRGYGCPNNPSHSITENLSDIMQFIPFI